MNILPRGYVAQACPTAKGVLHRSALHWQRSCQKLQALLGRPERCYPVLPIMSALLDALRWPNFIAKEDKQLKERALSDGERKKLGHLALVEGLSGTVL